MGVKRPGAPRTLRVFLIDDSATMRKVIRNSLSGDERIAVVGEAGDPIEAQIPLRKSKPDLILLDLEMPRMNGIDFLGERVACAASRVVVLSSKAQSGSAIVEKALSLGAVDVVAKPRAGQMNTLDDLAERLIKCHMRPLMTDSGRTARQRGGKRKGAYGRVLLIGASTGGVEAVTNIVAGFPAECPPTIVVQHMPENFLRAFVERLDRNVAPNVQVAADGQPVFAGQVLFAPGGKNHLTIHEEGDGLVVRHQTAPPVMGHIPSIDVLMQSAMPIAERACAVLLSGMGADGVSGLVALKAAGAKTAVQDQGTSVIFGMGRRAADQGGADRMLPMMEIGAWALSSCGFGVAVEGDNA